MQFQITESKLEPVIYNRVGMIRSIGQLSAQMLYCDYRAQAIPTVNCPNCDCNFIIDLATVDTKGMEHDLVLALKAIKACKVYKLSVNIYDFTEQDEGLPPPFRKLLGSLYFAEVQKELRGRGIPTMDLMLIVTLNMDVCQNETASWCIPAMECEAPPLMFQPCELDAAALKSRDEKKQFVGSRTKGAKFFVDYGYCLDELNVEDLKRKYKYLKQKEPQPPSVDETAVPKTKGTTVHTLLTRATQAIYECMCAENHCLTTGFQFVVVASGTIAVLEVNQPPATMESVDLCGMYRTLFEYTVSEEEIERGKNPILRKHLLSPKVTDMFIGKKMYVITFYGIEIKNPEQDAVQAKQQLQALGREATVIYKPNDPTIFRIAARVMNFVQGTRQRLMNRYGNKFDELAFPVGMLYFRFCYRTTARWYMQAFIEKMIDDGCDENAIKEKVMEWWQVVPYVEAAYNASE